MRVVHKDLKQMERRGEVAWRGVVKGGRGGGVRWLVVVEL